MFMAVEEDPERNGVAAVLSLERNGDDASTVDPLLLERPLKCWGGGRSLVGSGIEVDAPPYPCNTSFLASRPRVENPVSGVADTPPLSSEGVAADEL
jgi:hypothetical protein